MFSLVYEGATRFENQRDPFIKVGTVLHRDSKMLVAALLANPGLLFVADCQMES